MVYGQIIYFRTFLHQQKHDVFYDTRGGLNLQSIKYLPLSCFVLQPCLGLHNNRTFASKEIETKTNMQL